MASGSYWQRFQRERVSRRRLLGAAGAGAAGLAIVAACRDGGGEPSATATTVGATPATVADVPVRGGRYQIGSNVEFDTLDPHISIGAGPAYFPRLYNVLVRQSAKNPEFIHHDLAQEFETPDPGGTEWVFTIRPGVTIGPNAHGIPERALDADDVLMSFQRVKDEPQANSGAFVGQWLDTQEAPDKQTYIWRTPRPYAWFLLNIGVYTATIAPREVISRGSDFMVQNAVGAGPFVLASFGEGEGLSLDRNANYYRTDPNNRDEQLPYIDGMDVRIFPDKTAWRAAFTSGQVHVYGADNQAEANQLLDDLDIYQAPADPVNTFVAFTMNVTKPPWNNPLVRKAALHAINRQEYIDLIYGGDAKANGLVHWGTGAFSLSPEELEELQPWDPELAKQLIAQAGFDLPLRIKVMFPASNPIEEHDQHLPIFLEQMRTAGFEVDQDAQAFNSWLDNYTEKNYDASLALNQVYETPQVPLDFQHSRGPSGNDIFANGLQDPEVDAAIDASKELTDREELVQAVHDLQRLIYDKGPAYLPIVSPFSRTLRRSFVKNYPTSQGLSAVDALLVNTWWLDL